MQEIEVNSVEELEAIISEIGDGTFFAVSAIITNLMMAHHR